MLETIRTERVQLQGPRGPIDAYVAIPAAAGRVPAVLVVHEAPGLVDQIEGVARLIAKEGYLALVPDLFSGDTVRKLLDAADVVAAIPAAFGPDREAVLARFPAEKADVMRRAADWLRMRPHVQTYLPDLQAALAYLRLRDDVRADRVATLGFGMGGWLAGRLASSGAEIAATVLFYARNPPLEEIGSLRGPLLAHYAEQDVANTQTRAGLAEAMQAQGVRFEDHFYPGVGHAFANEQRDSYDKGAAEQAWTRTFAFLRSTIGAAG